MLDINLKSAFFGTQLAAKQMIAQGGGGRIINITSVHEDWPMPGNTPYCLSKGGMRMLTRTAGVELGAARHPRRRRRARARSTRRSTPRPMDDPAKMKTLDAAIPLGRMAEPERDRQRRRVPRRRRGRATSRPRRSSPTAASCTPAPGCNGLLRFDSQSNANGDAASAQIVSSARAERRITSMRCGPHAAGQRVS